MIYVTIMCSHMNYTSSQFSTWPSIICSFRCSIIYAMSSIRCDHYVFVKVKNKGEPILFAMELFLLIPPNQVDLSIFITASKRSLGQGNIFTPVCHFVHRGACVVAGGHAWLLGGHAWLAGGVCVVGGCANAWFPGGCVVGGCASSINLCIFMAKGGSMQDKRGEHNAW